MEDKIRCKSCNRKIEDKDIFVDFWGNFVCNSCFCNIFDIKYDKTLFIRTNEIN